MRNYVNTAVMAALVGVALGAQAAPLIDDFSVGQTFIKDSSTNAVGISNTVAGASILGGWRDLFVSKYVARNFFAEHGLRTARYRDCPMGWQFF